MSLVFRVIKPKPLKNRTTTQRAQGVQTEASFGKMSRVRDATLQRWRLEKQSNRCVQIAAIISGSDASDTSGKSILTRENTKSLTKK